MPKPECVTCESANEGRQWFFVVETIEPSLPSLKGVMEKIEGPFCSIACLEEWAESE